MNKENISARVVQHNALDHPATAADSADLFVERAACRQAWERCDAELKNAHADPVELHHAGTRLKQQLAGLAVSEDALRRLAYHDVLTGLANRLLLREYFCHELVQAGRRETRLAALFVDLDRFKDINDTYGHAAGDEVLKQVAARLLSCVRAGDIVSRYAGDEFVLVLVDIGALKHAVQIAGKVIEQICAPYTVNGHALQVTASIGIAIYPENGQDYDTLVQNADAAMLRVKNDGRNNYRFVADCRAHRRNGGNLGPGAGR